MKKLSERRFSMTFLPKYLIEFKSKAERCLGTVIDFVYCYVTWAKVFPDKLDLICLPYKQAYSNAVVMLDCMGGDNSTKTPMGVIHRIIYPMAA